MRVFLSFCLFVALSFHYRPAPTDHVDARRCSTSCVVECTNKCTGGGDRTTGPAPLPFAGGGGAHRGKEGKISGQERKWKGLHCYTHVVIYGVDLVSPQKKKGEKKKKKKNRSSKITLSLWGTLLRISVPHGSASPPCFTFSIKSIARRGTNSSPRIILTVFFFFTFLIFFFRGPSSCEGESSTTSRTGPLKRNTTIEGEKNKLALFRIGIYI